MHLQDALDQYLLEMQANGRAGHTIRQLRRHVSLYIRWSKAAGRPLDARKVTRADIAAFLVSPAATTTPTGAAKKPTSMNALRSSIRSFFGHLHDAGDIASNPARMVKRAVTGDPLPRALSDDELRHLLDTIAKGRRPEDVRDHLLFTTMASTGIRLSSALGLDVEDVDVDQGILRIRVKRDREQVVFLPEPTRELLRTYIAGREGALFQARGGRRLGARQAERRLEVWAKVAGLRAHVAPHMLRHTFATALLDRTSDLRLVQKALGHASISSTSRYAQVSDARLRAALKAT